MNRNLLIILVISVALLIALIGNNRQQRVGKLPWDITVFPDGRVHVLGITLNQTTVQEANQVLGNFAEPRLYLDESPRLLAVHDDIKLAGLSARIELQYHLDHSRLEALRPGALNVADQNYLKLGVEQEIALLATPIVKLIYIPVLNYAANDIERRFGEPDSTRVITPQLEEWHYDKLGLSILINAEGAETFTYVALTPPPPLEPLPASDAIIEAADTATNQAATEQATPEKKTEAAR